MDGLALKLLLVLHGVAAAVLTGAAVHNGLLSFRAHALSRPVNPRLQRVYPPVVAVAFALTFALGLVLYPSFRTGVRPGLETTFPLAIALFEVKEHSLAISLALLAYVVPSSRRLGAFEPGSEPLDLGFYHLACILLGAVALFSAVTGLLLTALEPV